MAFEVRADVVTWPALLMVAVALTTEVTETRTTTTRRFGDVTVARRRTLTPRTAEERRSTCVRTAGWATVATAVVVAVVAVAVVVVAVARFADAWGLSETVLSVLRVAVEGARAAPAAPEAAMTPRARAPVTSSEAGIDRRRFSGSTKRTPLGADRVS